MASDTTSLAATTGQANGPTTHSTTIFLGARRPTIAEQLASIGAVDNINIGNISGLPHLVYGKRQFVLEEWVRKKKTRSSQVHAFGWMVQELADDKIQGTYWICARCDAKRQFVALDARRQTSSVWSHLEIAHRIRKDGKRTLEEDSSQLMLDGRRTTQAEQPLPRAWADEFCRRMLIWMVATHTPFRSIEDDSFRDLLTHLNKPAVTQLLPSSGNTVKAWVMDRFSNAQLGVSKLLAKASSKIHLSWDLWTSPYNAAMLAVCCHFVDESLARRHILLALRPIRGDHTGLNQSAAVWAVVVE